MEYKYPEGKVLTDEEARELVRKEFEDARWVEMFAVGSNSSNRAVESVPTLKLLDSNGNEVNSFTVTTSADTFFSSVDSTWYEIDATVRPVLFHRDEQKSQTVAKMAVHSAHGARDFLTVLHCVSCR
eukprot:2951716-Prymnesium_polylepis.1